MAYLISYIVFRIFHFFFRWYNEVGYLEERSFVQMKAGDW